MDYTAYEEKMKKTIAALETEFASIRAGRANASVLDRISVEYYGSKMKINEVAQISSPDPRMLTITAQRERKSHTGVRSRNKPAERRQDNQTCVSAADRGKKKRTRKIDRQDRGRLKSCDPLDKTRRDGCFQGAKEKERDHGGRFEDRRKGHPEYDR